MKEATGELNMTVITVVAIAAVAAFFYAFVWPSIQSSLALTTACNSVDSDGNYNNAKGSNDDGAKCAAYSCSFKNSRGKVVYRTCDNKMKGTNAGE